MWRVQVEGWGSATSEHETRSPTWQLAGDTHAVATLAGLTDAQCAGREVDAGLVARWLDDGVHPTARRAARSGRAACTAWI